MVILRVFFLLIEVLARYIILQPLLRLLTKSPTSAAQSVLHVLFLPTPFKKVAQPSSEGSTREVLKAGALYRECAVVDMRIPARRPPSGDTDEGRDDILMADDGELGGVHLGQSVWEALEVGLKEWEKKSTSSEKQGAQTTSDTPS